MDDTIRLNRASGGALQCLQGSPSRFGNDDISRSGRRGVGYLTPSGDIIGNLGVCKYLHVGGFSLVKTKYMPGNYDIEYASPWAGANYMP
jgi:hypothetical protein